MRWAYIGNFDPPHSSENEIAKAIEECGHRLLRLQENEPSAWDAGWWAYDFKPDVLLWTRTGWDWPHTACGWSHEDAVMFQRRMLARCREFGIPSVARHLDRWYGLSREGQVRDEPFFRCDLVVTADGGHDELWEADGIRHVWLPPGVSAAECEGGTRQAQYVSDVAFVGSWRPGYHAEWKHRPQLIAHLQRRWKRHLRLWPMKGRPAVRGPALRDLYASVKVLIGDSCLAGGATRYWSDRIPESLGRGGFLLHPYVEGIEEHYTDGKHLRLWPVGDWNELDRLIAYYLEHDDERREIAEAGRRHVLETSTYTVQVGKIVDLLQEHSLL